MTPRTTASVVGAVTMSLVLSVFLVFKLYALRPDLNDDGIYFYAAARLTRGVLPYRHFFHAHPPLHLLPTALLFAVLGPSFAVGKAWIFALAAAQSLCVYLIVRRLAAPWDVPLVAEAAAVAAAVLLLSSETFLVASSDDTGLVQSSTAMTVAVLMLVRGRPGWAGAWAGAAACTSLQVAPLAASLGLVAVFRSRQSWTRFLLAGAAVVAVTHGIALIVGGRSFVEQVYLFHLRKDDAGARGWLLLLAFISHNWPVCVLAAVGLCTLALAGASSRGLALALSVAATVYAIAICTRPQVHYWYFVPLVAVLAIAAGAGLVPVVLTLGRRWCRAPPALDLAGTLVMVGVAAVLLATHRCEPEGIDSPHDESYVRRGPYRWHDAPGVGPLNGVVRALLFQGGVRSAPSRRYNVFTEYLWRHSVWLDTFPAISAAVAASARRHPEAVLFGDYATAPLVALGASIRLLGDEPDTTWQGYSSYASPLLLHREIERRLSGASYPLILLRTKPRGGEWISPITRSLFEVEYRETASFVSGAGVRHVLLEPRGTVGLHNAQRGLPLARPETETAAR